MIVSPEDRQHALVAALRDPARFPHPVTQVRVLETHISWVLLTGAFAYKLKRPVTLGFLDFSTLELRRRACEEELRLNRRLAPDIYLDLVPISGTPEMPRVGDPSAPIEYAVRMREFPQEALLDAMLARGELTPEMTEATARRVAAFHLALPPAPESSCYGTPALVRAYAEQNFAQLAGLVQDPQARELLDRLQRWSEAEFARCEPRLAARRREGRVREGHGDLHLGNIAWIAGAPVPFDCIEFNAELRWNDVMSEVAFAVMDLVDRGHPPLGWRFLNAWLETTGDYDGLAVLRFFLVYRALVRAKVSAIRAAQDDVDAADRPRLAAQVREYLALADAFAHAGRAALMITNGVTGSGKSVLAADLAARLGAIRLRSDVERKRLAGLGAFDRSHSLAGGGLYTPAMSQRTYERLAALAATALAERYAVIVDATFLGRARRAAFRALAAQAGAPFAIIAVQAPETALRQRVSARAAAGTDPSEADVAVLERQLATAEPLADDERTAALTLDTATGADIAGAAATLATRLGLPAPAGGR